jgi:hypothetical protein
MKKAFEAMAEEINLTSNYRFRRWLPLPAAQTAVRASAKPAPRAAALNAVPNATASKQPKPPHAQARPFCAIIICPT